MVCDKVCVTRAGGGRRGGGGGGARDTESKTRTPHKVVGKKDFYGTSMIFLEDFFGISL